MAKEIRYPNGFTSAQVKTCEHRGGKVGKKKPPNGGCGCKAQDVFRCALYELCTEKQVAKNQKEAVCATCMECSPKQ